MSRFDPRFIASLSLACNTPLSSHAVSRSQQRCIPHWAVEAIIDHGEERAVGRGATSYAFTRRAWQRFAAKTGQQARYYERYRAAYVVLADDGCVITVAWRH